MESSKEKSKWFVLTFFLKHTHYPGYFYSDSESESSSLKCTLAVTAAFRTGLTVPVEWRDIEVVGWADVPGVEDIADEGIDPVEVDDGWEDPLWVKESSRGYKSLTGYKLICPPGAFTKADRTFPHPHTSI